LYSSRRASSRAGSTDILTFFVLKRDTFIGKIPPIILCLELPGVEDGEQRSREQGAGEPLLTDLLLSSGGIGQGGGQHGGALQ